MSVVVFSKEELATIIRTLQLKNDSYGHQGNNWKFLDFQEELEYKYYDPNVDMQKKADTKIACWIDRLYIANQLAFMYSYEKSMTIDCIDEKDLSKGTVKNKKWLYDELKSLRYNLISNSGHSFVSKEDGDKLEYAIHCLADELIEDSEGDN